MKQIFKPVVGIVMTFLVFFALGTTSYASSVGFSIKAIPSNHQVDKKITYFDLKYNPGQKDQIFVDINNDSDKEITVDTAVDKSSTNSNGVVEYKNSKNFGHAGLNYDLGKIIKTNTPEVKVAPNETKKVAFDISMPEKEFDGVLAGGITVTEKDSDKTTDSSKKSGMAVKNRYSYTIAVVIHGKNELTKNNVTLGKVIPDQVNGRNSIQIPIQNESSAFLNKVKVESEVIKEGSDKALYSQSKEDSQMAPNSIYKFPLSTNGEELVPGKYVANVKVVSKDQHWEFSQKFEIKKEASQKLNKNAVLKEKDNRFIYLILVGLAILLILILIIYLLRKKNKEIKELNQQIKRDLDNNQQ